MKLSKWMLYSFVSEIFYGEIARIFFTHLLDNCSMSSTGGERDTIWLRRTNQRINEPTNRYILRWDSNISITFLQNEK